MKKEAGAGSKLGRWLGAPVRALSRACDSYVRKMSACAGHMPTHAAGAMGRGGFAPGAMQAATFSSRSRRGGVDGGGDDDDVGALVRALSQRQAASSASAATSVPVRSRSVAVGRIDEDAPCEFGAEDARLGPVAAPPHVRRSRSVAVGAGRAGVGFGAGAGAMRMGPGVGVGVVRG
ncbi:uncharacterized protein [Oryza sativa Japonica Group]|uniref:Os05g0512100 protein n=3 Tax=Oryza TaxID=4527 RepID=C7J2B9_ORYSJ|nr:uncharacterized protein LOC9267896 [Oryza sativa Japonica Group]KAF2931601.1 hypothetical protein DAI22_05g223900 [Oryza sativa Japonica Group]BAH93214.1 Os05g0512100 [Oryza sativa Japonica Group]BAS94849.1 Os05g0512100 [Oryza sativa Japonica Group]|eukprot:NP_001174486.1 Os05g0512100 [Oryza sativa Japonica Group]